MANTYYKQNHLKKLRAFCQTAKLGSMTKAAESLFASQPTISLQIHALEEEMDTLLFDRCGPKLTLTTEGSILYDLCLPHVQGIDRLKETFDAHCGNLTSGDLNIAAGESTILYILPSPFDSLASGIRLLNYGFRMKPDVMVWSCCVMIKLILRWAQCSKYPTT
jgi:DNA-binding transcriptional LysR family regulator